VNKQLYNFVLADTAHKLIFQESIDLENRNNASPYSSTKRSKGLSVLSAAIFIAGEMAGSGVLALPRAVVDSGEWLCQNYSHRTECLQFFLEKL
jgi:hypothetical protein